MSSISSSLLYQKIIRKWYVIISIGSKKICVHSKWIEGMQVVKFSKVHSGKEQWVRTSEVAKKH